MTTETSYIQAFYMLGVQDLHRSSYIKAAKPCLSSKKTFRTGIRESKSHGPNKIGHYIINELIIDYSSCSHLVGNACNRYDNRPVQW
jgi:hypothetical protein